MLKRNAAAWWSCVALVFGVCRVTAGELPPTPEEFLGFRVGADRKLVDYRQMLEYWTQLDASSERLERYEYGRSTQDNPLLLLFISSPSNLRDKERYRQISARVANPDGLSDAQAAELVGEGKAILMVVCNIHSTEIGPSQMTLEWVHELVTTADPQILAWLDSVILLLVPSANPDGLNLTCDWYRKYAGTRYDGGPMPWLYHEYAGHDLNRDWYMLTQKETRALNRVAYHEWFPQVVVDQHQMGSTGPRVFVPPYASPMAANVHPLIWRWAALLGGGMSLRLEESGKSGVIDTYAFDGSWVGGTRNTCFWKNTIGVLTEVASARIATPIHIDPMELSGDRKGLVEYRAQTNFPNPWPGGWWRLRDIIDYHIIFSNSALETCARHRTELLRDRVQMSRDALVAGRTGPPYAYVVPPQQHDVRSAAWLVDLLRENGVEAYRAAQGFEAGGERYAAGTVVFPMAQPYRAFLKELLEPQVLPEVSATAGESDPPYDVTGWTLPLLMGVECTAVQQPLDLELGPIPQGVWEVPARGPGAAIVAVSPRTNAAHRAVNRLLASRHTLWRAARAFDDGGKHFEAGTWIAEHNAARALAREAESLNLAFDALAAAPQVPLYEMHLPRIGIVQPWNPSMDEGWTRWVLECFEFRPVKLEAKAVRRGNLRPNFDVLIVPSVGREDLVDGQRLHGNADPMPPPYGEGLGSRGVEELRAFVAAGGTLVLLGEAGAALRFDLNLPVEDVAAGLEESTYSFPGTLVRIEVDPEHPIGYGMPPLVAAYHRDGPAFVTQPLAGELSRSIVARFVRQEPVIVSGWGRGTQHLMGTGAVVEIGIDQGRVVLMAPRVQHRGQTHATFKLLFNAIQLSAARLHTQPGG